MRSLRLSRSLALATMLGSLLPAVARAETLSATGTVTVRGTSTLHDWTVEAKELHGTLELPAEFLAGAATAPPTASFTLPAEALKSEHDRMNKLMWEALDSAKHPELAFALQAAKVASTDGASTGVEVDGTLTVAGVAKPVHLVLTVRQDGARLLASGELPLKMTDFGIKPPTAMLGTMKTGDAVTVKIDAVLVPGS